jgi:anti-sigma factor RsiW
MNMRASKRECADLLVDASAALDGELSSFRQSRVAKHCRSCASCASAVERMQGLTVLVREAGVSCPPPLEVTVPRRRRRRYVAPAWAIGFAATAAVAAGVFVTAPAQLSKSDEVADASVTNVSFEVNTAVVGAYHRRAVMLPKLRPPLARDTVH